MSKLFPDDKPQNGDSGEQGTPVSWTRAEWFGALARAEPGLLEKTWRGMNLAPDYAVLRAPEICLVMLCGRIGGDGAPFNFGEATVTRCSVRLASGEAGHACALGRHKQKAEICAVCDGLMQTPLQTRLIAELLEPLSAAHAATANKRRAQAAATRVEFFTMVRGESP